MRIIKFSWIPFLSLFSGMAFGQISQQNIYPFKDLVFPQVAAGGEYESWITVANRGPETWSGEMQFRRGQGVAWNPVVNGARLLNGNLSISVNAGATRTLKVTLPGSLEAGYCIIAADDLELTNFIEGHLTYYVSEGASVADAVGVVPAAQFMATSLPFESFNSIALALVNSDFQGRSANLQLRILNDSNVQVGQTQFLTLINGEYTAQYLSGLFPNTTLGRGRLEIESNVPISGIALTQATGKQLSSLPFGSTTRTYSVVSTGGRVNFTRLTLWTESLFVKGYVLASIQGQSGLFAVYGQIVDGKLHVHFDGQGSVFEPLEMLGYIKTDGVFTPGQSTFIATYVASIPVQNNFESGSFVATIVP
jgi:hypothetical protein